MPIYFASNQAQVELAKQQEEWENCWMSQGQAQVAEKVEVGVQFIGVHH